MSVIIKIRCTDCGSIHDEEVTGVLVLANKDDKVGIWYHDLTDVEILQLLSKFIEYLADKRVEEESDKTV